MKTHVTLLVILLGVMTASCDDDTVLFEYGDVAYYDNNQGQKILQGGCQTQVGVKLYELKMLQDALNGDTDDPAVLTEDTNTGDNKFEFNICRQRYDFVEQSSMQEDGIGDCMGKAQGYFSENGGADCIYSFKEPKISTFSAQDSTEGSTVMGFHLEYTSEETCGSGEEKMNIDLRFICDAEVAALSIVGQDLSDSNECQKYVTFKDAYGCEYFDISGLIVIIARYIGWILIIGGLIMTFYGANAIVHGITFIVFLAVSCIAFFFLLNIGLIKDPRQTDGDGPVWLNYVLIILCMGVGTLCAWLARKFIQEQATMLLGASAGGIILFFICSKIDMAWYIKIIIIAVGAIVGGYFSKKSDRYIKAGLTAIIGACLLMQGISFYTVGKSSAEVQQDMAEGEFDKTTIFLLVGAVIFAALGTYVQLKFFVKDIHEAKKAKDDYTSQQYA